jgi:phosphomannomutase
MVDIVAKHGGKAVLSKSGHAFINQVIRDCDAAYGGEISAHHYFRDFAYPDSGMIPWLIVLQVIRETGKSLSQLVRERMSMFPASGEINRKLAPEKGEERAVLALAESQYKSQAKSVDYTDGLSMEFDNRRLSIRASNTEPLVRLYVEARGDEVLMQAKTVELIALMDA